MDLRVHGAICKHLSQLFMMGAPYMTPAQLVWHANRIIRFCNNP